MRSKPEKLRDLAAWYREFADLAENPMIWQSRVRMAEDLESQADQLIAKIFRRAERRKLVYRGTKERGRGDSMVRKMYEGNWRPGCTWNRPLRRPRTSQGTRFTVYPKRRVERRSDSTGTSNRRLHV